MKNQALNSQSIDHIKESVEDIKAMIKEQNKTFATKAEHQQTANSVTMLWRWFIWAIAWIITALWTLAMQLFSKVI